MTIDEIVRQAAYLGPDEPLCDSCLAFACDTTEAEMFTVTQSIVQSEPAFDRGSLCVGCDEVVVTIVYRVPVRTRAPVATPSLRDAAAA